MLGADTLVEMLAIRRGVQRDHMNTLNERVRLRLLAQKHQQKSGEREIAQLIGWSQSKVSQKLSGRTPMTLDELQALCSALSLSVIEAVRDPDLDFCDQMTPIEKRLLDHIRQLPKRAADGLFDFVRGSSFERQRR